MPLDAVGELLINRPPVWNHLDPSNWLPGVGGLAYLSLVFMPGAWISFSIPLRNTNFWIKMCLAMVLSPTIVCAEFYALRFLGVSFPITAVVLVFLNFPAAYLIWKCCRSQHEAKRTDWLIGAVSVLLSLACLGSVLGYMDARIYSGASWLHADPVYMLQRGDLVPEVSTLAGVRMSYPVWIGLVFETIHSYLTQSPPQLSYVWSNLFLLIAVCGFMAGVTKQLGGGRAAQTSSVVFLLLGTNPVGYVIMHLFSPLKIPYIWGDDRYTPWVSKFMLFGPMTMGIAMTMAMIFFLVRPGSLPREVFIILGLLLCSIGMFYPLLFPSACGLIFARALAPLAEEQDWSWKLHAREILALAGLVLLACVVTYTGVRFITSARQNSSGEVLLSTLPSAARKLVEGAISTSLLAAGVALSIRSLWKTQRRPIVFLLTGAAVSYLLNVVFYVPYYHNEYKFIFTVAMCLAVFPAIALERIWREWRLAGALPATLFAGLLVFGAYGDRVYRNWPAPWVRANPMTNSYPQTYKPPLNFNRLHLQLNERDELYGISNAVSSMTPPLSVLLVDNSKIYYPELTNRSLYVSAENRSYPGVNLWADALYLEVGGYGPQILAERREVLAEFFQSRDPSIRQTALQTIQRLNRPIAVIVDLSHPDLLNWLRANKSARELYRESRLSLWMIEQTEASQ